MRMGRSVVVLLGILLLWMVGCSTDTSSVGSVPSVNMATSSETVDSLTLFLESIRYAPIPEACSCGKSFVEDGEESKAYLDIRDKDCGRCGCAHLEKQFKHSQAWKCEGCGATTTTEQLRWADQGHKS